MMKLRTVLIFGLQFRTIKIHTDFKNRIYPPELTLNCEDKSDQEVNYLDLHLEVKDSSIQYRLFDKRDNFSFNIVNFPDLSGNVPTNQSYGVFISQLVRFARCCQQFVDFKSRTLWLVERLLKQHFKLLNCVKRLESSLLNMVTY